MSTKYSMRSWINLIEQSVVESFGGVIDWNPRAANANLQLFNLDLAAHSGTLDPKDRICG